MHNVYDKNSVFVGFENLEIMCISVDETGLVCFGAKHCSETEFKKIAFGPGIPSRGSQLRIYMDFRGLEINREILFSCH